MLCSALLCYAMLCCAMLCYAVLWYALLCYGMLCCAVLCYALLWYALLCQVPKLFSTSYGEDEDLTAHDCALAARRIRAPPFTPRAAPAPESEPERATWPQTRSGSTLSS